MAGKLGAQGARPRRAPRGEPRAATGADKCRRVRAVAAGGRPAREWMRALASGTGDTLAAMTAAGDPHRILGLEPGASQAEIKRAYRRLAKVLHPDSAGERSLPAFLAVQEAYERLTGTKVRTVRAPGSSSTPSGTRGAGASGFREPWRADPARARAAREQSRTRRAGSEGSGSRGTGGAAGPLGSSAGARPQGQRSGSAAWSGGRSST